MKTVFTESPRIILPAAVVNGWQGHRHDGKAADGSAPDTYAADTGAANAMAIALTPPLTAHAIGLPLVIKVAADNTGACTLAVDGLAPVALTKYGNQALAAGDIVAGQMLLVWFDGIRYQSLIRTPCQFIISDADLAVLFMNLSDMSSGIWYPLDLSAYLPSYATHAIILVEWASTASEGHHLLVRPNGSSAAGATVMAVHNSIDPVSFVGITFSSRIIVPLGTSRKFDYSFADLGGGADSCHVRFYLQGWCS